MVEETPTHKPISKTETKIVEETSNKVSESDLIMKYETQW
jgi:hypothetical protein